MKREREREREWRARLLVVRWRGTGLPCPVSKLVTSEEEVDDERRGQDSHHYTRSESQQRWAELKLLSRRCGDAHFEMAEHGLAGWLLASVTVSSADS